MDSITRYHETTWIVNDVNWLHEFFLSVILNARIINWGYDANIHTISQMNAQYFYDNKQNHNV